MMRRDSRNHDDTCTWLARKIGANQSYVVLIVIVFLVVMFGGLFQEEKNAESMLKQLQNKMGLSNQQFIKLQKEHKTVQQQYTALLKELDKEKSDCKAKLESLETENNNLKKEVSNEGGEITELKSKIKGGLLELQKHVE